ncbi:MAG: thiamine-phosphate kinase [Nitrospirota bacterium]|nr:thiamine-phosphate kinase [Nitrospirota bacterium]
MGSDSPRRPSTRRLAEFPLIDDLARRFGATGRAVVRGIGDDTAILRPSSRDLVLLTTDLLAEGVHFDRTTATYEDIGFKAAVANLSDIAAMGGRPRYLLVSLAIPNGHTEQDIVRLYQGMMNACRPYDVELIGGDTSSSRHGLFINVTLTGSVKPGRALTRSGARIGDLLYVTGTLGDSLAGLQLLTDKRGKAAGIGSMAQSYLVERHLRPTPRLSAGQLLAKHRLATSAIDLSDGLSGDLAHICTNSKVGAEVDMLALPLSPACLDYAEARRKNPFMLALTGGEDYELLVTVPPKNKTNVERLARSFGCRLSRIGRIQSPQRGLTVIEPDGSSHKLAITSYRHFETRSHAR